MDQRDYHRIVCPSVNKERLWYDPADPGVRGATAPCVFHPNARAHKSDLAADVLLSFRVAAPAGAASVPSLSTNAGCDFARLAGCWSIDGADWLVPNCTFNTTPTHHPRWTSSRTVLQPLYTPNIPRMFLVGRQIDRVPDKTEEDHWRFWSDEWWPLPGQTGARQAPISNGEHARTLQAEPAAAAESRTSDAHGLQGTRMCLVGDSNTREMMPAFLYAVHHSNRHSDAQIAFKFHEAFPHDVCSDKLVPSQHGDPTYFDTVKRCVDEPADVIILSLASHAPGQSPRDLRDLLDNLTHVLGGGAADMSAGNRGAGASATSAGSVCVLVVSTLDFKYESVPSKFNSDQSFFRSSFRQGLKNEFVRNSIESSRSVHYVDLFSPSVALHFDGHNQDDPVHFYAFRHFYEQASEILLAAAARLC